MSEHEERLELIKEHLSNAECTTFTLVAKVAYKPDPISGYMVGYHDSLDGLEVEVSGFPYNVTDSAFVTLDLTEDQERRRFRFNFKNKIVPYNPK